jgi:hypothetical protein
MTARRQNPRHPADLTRKVRDSQVRDNLLQILVELEGPSDVHWLDPGPAPPY